MGNESVGAAVESRIRTPVATQNLGDQGEWPHEKEGEVREKDSTTMSLCTGKTTLPAIE